VVPVGTTFIYVIRNTVCVLLLLCCATLIAQEDTVKVNIGMSPEQNAELDYNKGLQALQSRDFTTAADLFTRCLAVKPGFDKALSNRAIAFTNLKRYEEALADIRLAIQANPQNEENFFNKSLIFAGMGARDSQEVALDQCLALNGQHADAAYYKGMLHYERSQYDKAIGYYNVATASRPNFAYAYNDRGSAKRAGDDLAGAIADYLLATRADSTQPFIYNNLGSAYRLNKQNTEAIQAYTKALQLDSRYLVALINRGVAYFDANMLKQAQTDFEEALSVDAKNSHAYNNLSSIAIKNGDYKKAKELAERAITLNGKNGPAYYNRGIARQMLREEEGSCADWKRAFELGVSGARSFINASCLE
jgi:tetratricopeptide (TPR) repeat protein